MHDSHMVNILFVHQSADLYGSDRALLTLLQRLDPNKYKPIVVLPREGPLAVELRALGVETHTAPLALISRSTLSPAGLFGLVLELGRSIRALDRLVEGRRIELVHSNTLAVISGGLWAWLRKIPNIWHVHEIVERPIFVRKGFAWLLWLFASRVVCVSNAAKENLVRDVARLKAKTVVVYNGVQMKTCPDRSEIESFRGFLNARRGDFLILQVGRVNRLKGQAVLIDAVTKIWVSGYRNIRVILVGDPVAGQEYYLEAMRKRIADSSASDVFEIHPFTQEIARFFCAADLVVVPSTEPESFGLVAVEAMAAHKPVIGTRHGGLVEIVAHDCSGKLVAPGAVDELTAAITELLVDPVKCKRMGEVGFERYCGLFSVEQYLLRMEDVYSQTLEGEVRVGRDF